MSNNKQEQKQLLIDMMNDDAKDGLYENTTLNQLIKLYEDQITQLEVMSKIELGDDVIEEINKLKSQLLGGKTNAGENNTVISNPGPNQTGMTGWKGGTTIDKLELETLMIMYLDGIEFYGTDEQWVEAKAVFEDFMRYINNLDK